MIMTLVSNCPGSTGSIGSTGRRGIGRSTVLATVMLALLGACAVNHSENFVSLVLTQEAGAPAAALTNVEIVIVDNLFGATTTKGKFAPGMEIIANRQLVTLLPALRRQLPSVLGRNGIAARVVPIGQPSSADDIITIQPKLAQDFHGANGAASIGIKLAVEIRHRNGTLVWSGSALERASPSRPDTMQWSDAMAEDLARTLLSRLGKDGVIKLGVGGGAEPV
jgi:hypothetical protein